MLEERLMEKAISLMREKGQKSVELAKFEVLQEKVINPTLQEALKYFIEDWNDFLHPALLFLACEAVGGDPKFTTQFGSSIVLLAGGADIHDDIIDKSIVKEPKQTVFGKFGEDIAILAGDILLLKGLFLLNEACDLLSKNKKMAILEIIKNAFLESSSAEATEANLRGKTEIKKDDILNMIKQKVATAEAVTRIGAVLGNATDQQTTLLGQYGRTVGMLLTIRDEFVDVFEKDELMNRAQKEILPLPILLSFNDEKRKAEILQFLSKQIKENDVNSILDLVMKSDQTRDLVKLMKQIVDEEKFKIESLYTNKSELKLLLDATIEDL
jgi:geranylgeranyl pyrophosphate synthase